MTLEEKLHEQFDWLTVKHVDASNAIKEIVALHQQEIDEACKKAKIAECEYWRDIIFSPEQQAIKPTISLTDFQLRIVDLQMELLNAPSPEGE